MKIIKFKEKKKYKYNRKVNIKNLILNMFIGIHSFEKKKKQRVKFNIEINTDPNLKPELSIRGGGKVGRRGSSGESKNFNKELSYRRLIKKRKEGLDFGSSIRETTGDMLLEGRHGNSIRIGSRSNDPYVFISNRTFTTMENRKVL